MKIMCYKLNLSTITFYISLQYLGSKYSSFDITSLLRKRHMITNEIHSIAQQHRETLKEQLTEPYLNRSLTLIPDIWKEKRNSSSFLGCSVSMVDKDFQFTTFDLFCKEFEESNQSFMSIINVGVTGIFYIFTFLLVIDWFIFFFRRSKMD